jgi:DNA-binding response OmpR family regulator
MDMSKIAIVDDDKNVCEMLRDRLTGSGHECCVINDGGGAFKKLKDARPDLILLDLMMSEVSGFRLCRMIRRDPLLYTVPVMVLAAAEDEPEVLHCIEHGADDYVTVPLAAQDVIRKVRGLLLLQDAIGSRDPLTGMPGTVAVKREINHRLARGEAIATCYIGMTNGTQQAKNISAHGSSADSIVRDMGRLIGQVADELHIYEVFAGYVGAAHFVVVLSLDQYQRFCKRCIEKFDVEIAQRSGRPRPGISGDGTPKISVGVAHNQHREYRSADKMFQVLAEVHRKAQESATSSCFVDRRRIDR